LRPALILLDLRDLAFTDLSGLRVVLAADQRTKARGGELAVAHAPRVVFRLARLSGVDSLLRFVTDRAATQFDRPAGTPAPGPALPAR
jgi:anti-anti-sigma factor